LWGHALPTPRIQKHKTKIKTEKKGTLTTKSKLLDDNETADDNNLNGQKVGMSNNIKCESAPKTNCTFKMCLIS